MKMPSIPKPELGRRLSGLRARARVGDRLTHARDYLNDPDRWRNGVARVMRVGRLARTSVGDKLRPVGNYLSDPDRWRNGSDRAKRVGYWVISAATLGAIPLARAAGRAFVEHVANSSRGGDLQGRRGWKLSYAEIIQAEAGKLAAAGKFTESRAMSAKAEERRKEADISLPARLALGAVAAMSGNRSTAEAHIHRVSQIVDDTRP